MRVRPPWPALPSARWPSTPGWASPWTRRPDSRDGTTLHCSSNTSSSTGGAERGGRASRLGRPPTSCTGRIRTSASGSWTAAARRWRADATGQLVASARCPGRAWSAAILGHARDSSRPGGAPGPAGPQRGRGRRPPPAHHHP
jgi:hypothetical protein